MLLFLVTVAFASFCVLSLGVAPCVFQLIHGFNSVINVNQLWSLHVVVGNVRWFMLLNFDLSSWDANFFKKFAWIVVLLLLACPSMSCAV